MRLFPASATYTTPLATVTSYGFLKLTPFAAVSLQFVDPSGFRLSTLFAKVSATISLFELASTAYGQVSAPPMITEFPAEVPEVVNCSRRLFLVSATHSVLLPGAKLMSRGQLNPLRSPFPQPRAPNVPANVQASPVAPGANSCIRWLTESATYRLPLLSKVIPEGSLKKPPFGGTLPNTFTGVSVGDVNSSM